MFASNLQAQNVPINQTFITDIAVSINSDQQKALSGISRYGFSCVGAQTSRDDYNRIDFNQDAKGDFAYVGMKYSKDYTKAITDIICRVDGFNENAQTAASALKNLILISLDEAQQNKKKSLTV